MSTGPGLTVFFGILLLIMETLGNFLLFCMTWYEKFGMDSKKRTISNQLLSKMIFAVIFFNIFCMPLLFGLTLINSKYFQGFYYAFKSYFSQYCNICAQISLTL